MKTDEANLQAAQVFKSNHLLRSRMNGVKERLETIADEIKREAESISASLKIEYTGWCALLKLVDGKWICLACVDSNNLPDNAPEDFDVCLPIPQPDTMPEWEGW